MSINILKRLILERWQSLRFAASLDTGSGSYSWRLCLLLHADAARRIRKHNGQTFDIPPNTSIVLDVVGVHHNPRYWGKMQMFSALHVGSWTRRTSYRRTRSASHSIIRTCYVPRTTLLSYSATVIARGLRHPMPYGARCIKTHGRLWTKEEV